MTTPDREPIRSYTFNINIWYAGTGAIAIVVVIVFAWILWPQPNPATAFDNGAHRVGTDIVPGTYRTKGALMPPMVCSWARTANEDGAYGPDLPPLDMGQSVGAIQARVLPTDGAFVSRSCQTWTMVEALE